MNKDRLDHLNMIFAIVLYLRNYSSCYSHFQEQKGEQGLDKTRVVKQAINGYLFI
jgi:hypothetical protein